MLKKSNLSKVILAGLLVLSLVGCGGNPVGETGLEDQQGYDTGSSIGDFNNNPATNNDPYSGNQGTQTNGYANTPIDLGNALTANVMSKDTSGFWLWKKATGTVMVNNSSQSQVSGTLNVTFTLKGETVESQQQSISLSAGESKQIEVKATKHSDDVTVSVTPDSTGQFSSNAGATQY